METHVMIGYVSDSWANFGWPGNVLSHDNILHHCCLKHLSTKPWTLWESEVIIGVADAVFSATIVLIVSDIRYLFYWPKDFNYLHHLILKVDFMFLKF